MPSQVRTAPEASAASWDVTKESPRFWFGEFRLGGTSLSQVMVVVASHGGCGKLIIFRTGKKRQGKRI